MHRAIMVMGVSGCGKSTVGLDLAQRLSGCFIDGDDYHPARNRANMAAGKPLTDAMRWPWLDAVGQAVQKARLDRPVIFACSALKAGYRDHLRDMIPQLQVFHLSISRVVAGSRVGTRKGHFMPESLLDSQFATLEFPQDAVILDAEQTVDQIVQSALKAL